MRILCIDTNRREIERSAIQLGTGEGKSVVLAISACIFALFGFDVDIACYSQYLTDRDRSIFEPLFIELGFNGEIGKNNIQYGTFKNLCESLINSIVDLRQLIKSEFEENKKGIKFNQ